MESRLTRTRLANGLEVLLKEIHTAPIISHWVWYRVGSRNEPPGLTGSSHWVEHMQFKGTRAFPSGILDKAISREGGVWNAFTYLDWTTFFETMPSNKIDLALNLEADRMVNSLFQPEEVASERTVIISEREGNENEPLFELGEAIQADAFKVHSYHHEVIGDMADLHTMTRDDLYNHYRNYYAPNNAVVAIAGDFDSERMLRQINEVYGMVPSRPTKVYIPHLEPVQGDERKVDVSGPGETTFLQLAYHAPNGAAADFFPLSVLDSLLTGPTSLNMFGGGGISNKTSRLYRSLIDKELAVSINGSLQATIDPYLYMITITLRPEKAPEAVIQAVNDEIHRLQDELVHPDEIARAIKQARALFAYSSENITNQAYWLGYAEMFANYDWFLQYTDRLATVTPADVQRIAQQYLGQSNRVIGTYLPIHEEVSQ